MQEKIEDGMVTLVLKCSELSSRELKEAARDYIGYIKKKETGKIEYLGEMKIEDIAPKKSEEKKTPDVNIKSVTGKELKDFDKTARKYGVRYAVREAGSGENKKQVVCLSSKKRENIDRALAEFSAERKKGKTKDGREKYSVIEKLGMMKEFIKNHTPRHKSRYREAEYER